MKPQPIILGETFTFTRINWKTFRVIYILVIFTFFISFFLFITKDIPHLHQRYFLSFYLVALLFNIRFWGFLTRVTISPEGIRYSTPFRTKIVEWSSIKTAGIYVQKKNGKYELPAHRYTEKFYLKEKFIFFSRQPNYSPWFFSFFESNFVDFHYRIEAWELIEFYLGKKENKGSSINFQ